MENLQVEKNLAAFYDDYFPDDPYDLRKRQIAAEDSLSAIQALHPNSLGHVLDVGAGDGVLCKVIHDRLAAKRITAVEISDTGLTRLSALGLPIDARKFDGYSIPFKDKYFDSAVCTHVLEHVEHERLFLREIARVTNQAFFVVPLEGGARGRVFKDMGHINYYTPLNLTNLIETSGFEVLGSKVFNCSLSYEKHIYGPIAGSIKNAIRSSLVTVFGNIAPHFVVCIMAVHCRPRTGTII